MSRPLLRLLVVIITLVGLPVLLAGCGGGGATATTDGTSPAASTTTAPLTSLTPASGLNVTIASRLGLAKDASAGYQWRVHVRATPTGEDLASARTVPAPTSDGGQVTVSFGRVPSHASVIVVEVLAPSGAVVSTQSAPFTWSPTVHTTGQTVSMTVTMPLVALRESRLLAVPPAANVSVGGTLQLRAVGGTAPYGYEIDQTDVDGSRIEGHTGLYTAGRDTGIDQVTVRDKDLDVATATLYVAPRTRIEPAAATVAPGTRVKFQAVGDTPGVWNVRATSGGTIDFHTGEYVAGQFENAIDVVELTDAAGHKTSALVSVASPITISPSSVSGVSGGTYTFTASGGTGTYMWHLVNDASGGNIDAQSGFYHPGPTHGVTDVVAVSDSSGAMALIEIPVAAPLALNGSLRLTAPLQGTISLTCSGGYAPYTVTLQPNHDDNRSFIPPDGSWYLAGSIPGYVDKITITDSRGNTATALVTTGPGITVTPARTAVKPNATLQFTATGGAGAPYRFTVQSSCGSTIDEATGAYVAGPNSGYFTDTVLVYDANNNEGVAFVNVYWNAP